MFDPSEIEAVKNALPYYLDRFHAEAISRKSTHQIKLRCPLHREKTASFIANDRSGVWLWKCFGCQAAGSIFDLHALTNGLDPRSSRNVTETAKAVSIHLSVNRDLSSEEKATWIRAKRKRQREARERASVSASAERITRHLKHTLEAKLAPYRCDDGWRPELWESSPFRIEDPTESPHHFISQLFRPHDLLWMGETYESGLTRHRDNFRHRDEWLKLDHLPPRIAAGTFQAESINRSIERIETSPFIVLESDDLIGHKPKAPTEKERNKAMSYALFHYVQDRLGLTPRAVVDTSNKSLHLWFDRPPPVSLDGRFEKGRRIGKEGEIARKSRDWGE
ncbi:MAG: CHC2 zinc finger domain-containing protein [Verrucomicrobiales bacterium]